MVVQSFGALHAMTDSRPSWGGPTSDSSVRLYGHSLTYAAIYATQPNVRTCVDFLGRNCAELALQAFRRISDTDRERLADHELVDWLGRPNPTTSRYRLMEALVCDLAIYFNAYWLKVPDANPDGTPRIGLARLPPEEMRVIGGLMPSSLEWTRAGKCVPFELGQVVRFDGYNPLNPLMGLSPLETLRRTLAEEAASGEHRESYWRHASRHEGIIERPAAAPKWDDAKKKAWREQWQQRFAGPGGSGMVPVLEDGMTFRAASFSPKDSEYTAARKLTREECAAAFHIPLPMVGILEHATFSNIREQHKHLYQDCLGPWLRMIKEEIERQLLIECSDQTDVYTEFNIEAKLAGSFEERATALQVSVGRPWRTVNEARAIENLPRDDDPESDRVAPQQGGPAAAAPPPFNPAAADAVGVAPVLDALRARVDTKLEGFSAAGRVATFVPLRFRLTRELAADLRPIIGADADRLARQTIAEIYARLLAAATGAAE